MSFPEAITLTDGTNSNTVSTISVKDGETVRRDASRGLGLPLIMRIGTQKIGKGVTISNRHIVRLDSTINYDVDDPAAKISRSVYLNIVEPEVIFSISEVMVLVNQLKAFATVGNITKLLNGES